MTLDRCSEIHYTFGGFANGLFVYTPSLSLPLFKGEGTPPEGKRPKFGAVIQNTRWADDCVD